MQTTQATKNRRPTQPATPDAQLAANSQAWAQVLDKLPHTLKLSPERFKPEDQPALQRVELIAGDTISPEKWASLDKAVRSEVVRLLNRTGVAPRDLAPKGQKIPPPQTEEGTDGFQRDLSLSWTALKDKLPFNLYYNTVNPSYVRVELREQLDAITEELGDKSPLEHSDWGSLAAPLKQALAYRRIRHHLDPNGAAPITRDEWKAMEPKAREEVLLLLQESGFGLAHFQRPKSRESHAGRSVKNVAPGKSGGEDERTFELSSGVTSLANIVTPVLSRTLTEGRNKYVEGTFDFERDKIVDNAQKFLVTRYYGFERGDYADRLIAAAKRGVKVEVELHPPETATRRRAQQAAFAKLEEAQKNDPKVRENLSLSKATILPHDPDKEFPQIMHEKSVIADTADGTLVELEGGINGGTNSPNNLDYAMRVEGSAVLDALRKYLSYRAKAHSKTDSVAEQIIRAYPRSELEKRVVQKAKAEGQPLTKTQLGGGGMRTVPQPETYSPQELQERADAGLSINLSIHDVARFSHLSETTGQPRWRFNEEMAPVLRTALENKSALTITIPRDDENIDQGHYLAIKEATAQFRKLGALVCWDDTVVRDVSYQNLIYQNLDLAIERGESCEIAAFALTDAGVMERIVNLHRKLKELPEEDRPPVKVAVHELEIDDYQVNQKVAALTTAGVDVVVFTERDAVGIAQKLSKELGERILPEHVKLHAKGMILGRAVAGGDKVDPRTAHGSANFSVSGFEKNIEGGRIYHQPQVADEIQDRIFEEIFAHCRPVDKLEILPLAHRESMFPDVPLDTPIEDVSFMAYDLETTGFAAHFGDVPVSMAAVRESLKRTENADGTVTWSRGDRIGELDAQCGLGFNAFGTKQKVPKASADIHGLTADKLKDAPPLKNALAQFKQLVEQSGKPAVPLAHNLKFDAPFLDIQYARPSNHMEGINQEVVDQASVCTMELAKEALPFKPKSERAEGELRQSYKLTALAEQLAGRTQSEIHNAFEDVDLALDVLVGLANKLQARTLRDLLPEDKLYLDQVGSQFTIYDSPTGQNEIARFSNDSDARVATSHGRSLKDGTEMFGAPKKIYEHKVIGFEGDRIQVQLATTKGESGEAVTGWVPADQVRFYQGGKTYWDLRETGKSLRVPFQMSRGEFWRQETEVDSFEKLGSTPSKDAKTIGKPLPMSSDRLARLTEQLEAAEKAMSRSQQQASDAGLEAKELARIARQAEAFAEATKTKSEDASQRVTSLRARIAQANSSSLPKKSK